MILGRVDVGVLRVADEDEFSALLPANETAVVEKLRSIWRRYSELDDGEVGANEAVELTFKFSALVR